MENPNTLLEKFLKENNLEFKFNTNIRELKDGGLLIDKPTMTIDYIQTEESK